MSDEKIKKNSDAKIKANNKYKNAHYKKLSVDLKPELCEQIRNTAKAEGISLAQYITNLHNNHISNIK